MLGTNTQNVIANARGLVGQTFYLVGGIEYMDVPPVSVATIITDGTNCSGYFNWSRAMDGLLPVGGTPDYANEIGPYWWEYLQNPAKQYPPGTYLVNDNVGVGFDFSHVAMVSTWDQWVLQSDNYQGRGPHELEHVSEAHQYNNFYYAGLLDDQPVLDGFPGYSASPQDIARWTGGVMEFFGLPRHLFVQCSLPELTTIWQDRPGGDTASIWDLPGFSTAVDNDSYGPAQQRLAYYPFPWNFETAVWSFAQQALAKYPGSDPGTAEGHGEWIQDIQGSAYSDRYAQWYDTAIELVGSSHGPPNPGPIEEGIVFARYSFAAVGEANVDISDAAETVLKAQGVDAMSVSSEANIAALSKQAAATNQVATLNCLTVGEKAHQLLDDSAQPLDDWKDGDPIWKLWADTDAGTLKRVRDWALVWIAATEKLDKDKLLATFDGVLMALDSKKYGELLAEAEQGNHPAPPPMPLPPSTPVDPGKLTAVRVGDLKPDDLVAVYQKKEG